MTKLLFTTVKLSFSLIKKKTVDDGLNLFSKSSRFAVALYTYVLQKYVVRNTGD